MADWDELSNRYDDIFLEDPIYRETLERMVQRVEEGDAARILDLGCGTGNLMARLLERFPGARVSGVDPSQGMREACARRLGDHPRATISAGDALAIPFPDDGFDYVLSNLALHHVPPERRKECAMEIARALKPGGKLIHADVFSGVAGPPEDPDRCRDIIERIVAKALHSLEHGAFRMMLGELSSLSRALRQDGEYLVTPEEWNDHLRRAGFGSFTLIDMPPVELVKILCCRLGD